MDWSKAGIEILSDFGMFLKELAAETDRGCAIISMALIDIRLKEILLAFLVDSKSTSELIEGFNAPLSSLSARTKAAFSLGLLTKQEYDNINIFRKIRNEFAHHPHGISFTTPTIISLCSSITLRFELLAKNEEQTTDMNSINDKSARMKFSIGIFVLTSMIMIRARCAMSEKREILKYEWD
ncbi:MltR family transcriptional regulator [Pontiellaceae bacterium B1224]|nr:MltR family transcriptional regulator [Pontiellaceae bacterium B1224]